LENESLMAIQKPSAELPLGDSISLIFHLYSKNFFKFLVPVFVAYVLTGILTALMFIYILTPIPNLSELLSTPQLWNWFLTYILPRLALLVVLGVIAAVMNLTAEFLLIKYASDLIERGSANLEDAFRFTLRKLGILIINSLIIGVIVVLGIIALVIPGIILAVMFSLTYPAILNENAGIINSLSRSRQLVSKRWLKTFAYFFVLAIIMSIFNYIVSLILTPVTIYSPIASYVISIILIAFVIPITPIGVAVYYYSMLAREKLSLPQTPPSP